MHFILEERAPLIIVASPAPHILTVAVRAAVVQDDGADDPHDGSEDEEADSEGGVVNGCLLGAVVAAAPVGPEYQETDEQRDAGDAEEGNLRPGRLAGRPGGEAVTGCERVGGAED